MIKFCLAYENCYNSAKFKGFLHIFSSWSLKNPFNYRVFQRKWDNIFLLLSQPIKHFNASHMSNILTETIAFWYTISKKIHLQILIIYRWGIWRCEHMKYQNYYYFANVSTSKARIFIRFKKKKLNFITEKWVNKFFFVKICAHAHAHKAKMYMRMCWSNNICALVPKLYENFNDSPLLCHDLTFRIT